jgi:hypothetical protein
MKQLFLFVLFGTMIFTSCIDVFNEKVNGNGNVTTVHRNVSNTEIIKSHGSFDVNIMQGETPGLSIEADENLIPYIITENAEGGVVIHTKEGYNLSSDNKIKITVTTNKLREVEAAGSGNITGTGKFTGSDYLNIGIAGSGDVTLEANTPRIDSHIGGSGNITLSGETKNSKIEIAGDGNYRAENLLSEDVEIHIAGSGNAKVFAENKLDIHIAGSGDVSYKGNAAVTQDIAGSGRINKID